MKAAQYQVGLFVFLADEQGICCTIYILCQTYAIHKLLCYLFHLHRQYLLVIAEYILILHHARKIKNIEYSILFLYIVQIPKNV